MSHVTTAVVVIVALYAFALIHKNVSLPGLGQG